MAVQELRVVEERCDRCELLIAKKQLGSDGEVVLEKIQAKNTGRFFLGNDQGKAVIDYEVVCDRCRTLLDGLIEKMGKVNRGTRNRSKKKKEETKDKESSQSSKAKQTSKKTNKKK